MDTNNNPNTESLEDVIRKIESQEIALPEFQRDFVWDLDRTYDLFDSLLRDVFIGSIIYGIPSFGLAVRELDARPRKAKGQKRKPLKTKYYTEEEIRDITRVNNFRVVLDGQQRLTSIYRALKGFDNVWCIFKFSDELEADEQDKEISKLSLESLIYCVSGQEDPERISINLASAYKKITESLLDEDYKEEFEKSAFYGGLSSEDEKKSHFKAYLHYLNKIVAMYKRDKLVAYFLLDMSAEKFALFFERSNSRGITLSFVDILVAKLINGFNLKREIEKFESENEGLEINREIIARTIAYLVSNGKKVDKKYILTTLKAEDFKNHWDNVLYLYKAAINYLSTNHFILNLKWIPYPNTLIPIMMFLDKLPQKKFSEMTQSQKKYFDFWYWNSVLSQRYVSSTNETIVYDSRMLGIVAEGGKITDELYIKRLKSSITSYEDVLVYNKKGSAVYIALLNLINYYSKGLLDWNNCSKIDFSDQVDDHHIFPKEYLAEALDDDVDRNLINSVANRTLMPKITNIKVGKKPPNIYLNELKGKNPEIEAVLENHLIPKDVMTDLYVGFYEVFLEDRAKMIFKAVDLQVNANREQLEQEFLKKAEKPSDYAGSINIFATYRNKKVEASFNIDLKEVLYNGTKSSPTSAAVRAKVDMGGHEVSTNGWKWWRYVDSDGRERFIDDYRY